MTTPNDSVASPTLPSPSDLEFLVLPTQDYSLPHTTVSVGVHPVSDDLNLDPSGPTVADTGPLPEPPRRGLDVTITLSSGAHLRLIGRDLTPADILEVLRLLESSLGQ